MNKPKDGGSAFPMIIDNPDRSQTQFLTIQGMSLRDYFAAAAMQGYIAAGLPSDVTHSEMAEKVYRAADAMLAYRNGDMPWCGICECYHSPKAEHIDKQEKPDG